MKKKISPNRTLKVKVADATNMVGIHFNNNTKATIESRIKRSILHDVKMNRY